MYRPRCICVIVLLAAGMVFFLTGCARQIAFDQKIWLANPQPHQENNSRSRMMVDLIRNHLKVGTEQQKVRALLGKPDAQSEDDREKNIDVYDLGLIGPMGIDPSILRLRYDGAKKLIKIEETET